MNIQIYSSQMEKIINATISAFEDQGIKLSVGEMETLDELLSGFAVEHADLTIVEDIDLDEQFNP